MASPPSDLLPFVAPVEGHRNVPSLLKFLKISMQAQSQSLNTGQQSSENRRSCCSYWVYWGHGLRGWVESRNLEPQMQRLELPRCASCPEMPSKGSPKGQERTQRLCPAQPLYLQSDQNARATFLGPHSPMHTGFSQVSCHWHWEFTGDRKCVDFKKQAANNSKDMAGERLACSFLENRLMKSVLSQVKGGPFSSSQS